ncbi:MAG TPA: hypothetical protein VIP70_12220 [Nitrososphaeraceae archaeon]
MSRRDTQSHLFESLKDNPFGFGILKSIRNDNGKTFCPILKLVTNGTIGSTAMD